LKKMLINAKFPEEVRVAVVEDGLLTEFHMESPLKEQLKGNIYKARIAKVEHGLNAVFVDFGRERHGLLPVSDINAAFVSGLNGRKPDLKDLRPGMDLLVQVVREEKGSKGALLTAEISLPGRFVVLLPRQDMSGVSRRIEDASLRSRLREIVAQIKPPEGMGVIVRTAGMDRTKTELSRDLSFLLRLWAKIEDGFDSAPCPSLVYHEGDVVIRTIRDYLTADTGEILVDDEETMDRILGYMETFMPRQKGIVKAYRQARPLFAKYELERQIESIFDKTVQLRSGGSIVIESTEAMVTIDVNSGQAKGTRNIEQTALETNLEAAQEIARQLVLRDLGGLVAIDFIDMKSRENVKAVEKALREALKKDKAHVVVGRISKLGILELSRERLSPPLMEKSHVACPVCSGNGLVRSVESSAMAALRQIQSSLSRSRAPRVDVTLSPEVAMHLVNECRRHIDALESEFKTRIHLKVDEGVGRPFCAVTHAE